jgi:Ran GTPase-activating protein (RanGAP) involved in mRNA processing and transport
MLSSTAILSRRPPSAQRPPERDPLIYDFSTIDRDVDDESPSLWSTYKALCYARVPPIPALSIMQPVLFGDQATASFSHQMIGPHLPIVLDLLLRTKIVTELDLTDNALTSAAVKPLVTFVTESDQLSVLLLDDNPIGSLGMQDLIEGIKDSRSLEQISICNTGCSPIVGHSIGNLLVGCTSLLKLNISHCRLRQSLMEIAQSLPAATTLRSINAARNDLFYGQRRLGLQFGVNAAKCTSLTRIDLSQNALTSEMASALLKGLGEAPRLHRLDLSRNNIDEPAGRAFVTFIEKCAALRRLVISQNPMLNVTKNQELWQQKLDEEAEKPGGGTKKNKKPKKYIPACYAIITALAKAVSVKQVDMVGLIVDSWEWERKLEELGDRITVVWRGADAEGFKFRVRAPPITIPVASESEETPRRAPRKK